MTAHTSREVRGERSQRMARGCPNNGRTVRRSGLILAACCLSLGAALADAAPFSLLAGATDATVPLPTEAALDFDSVLVDESSAAIGGATGSDGAFDPEMRSNYAPAGQADTIGAGVMVSDQQPGADGSIVDQLWSSSATFVGDAGGFLGGRRGWSRLHSGWDVQVEAMMLWQGNVQRQPILIDDATGIPALVSNEVLASMASGPRVTVVRPVGNAGHSLEGVYFCVQPFGGQASVPGPGQTGPFALATEPPFNDISAAQVLTNGRFQNAELNWRRYDGGIFTWMAGFRWMELNQGLSANYEFTNPDPYGTGTLSTTAGNDLYGGQIGTLMKLWNSGGRLTVDGLAKAGIFYNRAYQETTAFWVETQTGDSVYLGSPSGRAEQTAFVGEIGVNGTLWLTDWLAWRAGYTAYWLSGVASAPQQIPVSDFSYDANFINTNGSVLIHGVTTGLEARW